MHQIVRSYLNRAAAFEKEVHDLFGMHESSRSRIILLNESYLKLQLLNIKQDQLMRQAFRCIEENLFSAAHVMAWAALMDFYEEILESDGLIALRRVRSDWKHTKSMADLREYQSESQLIDLAQLLGLTSKNEMKALQGLLNRRNQCAHPSSYTPDLNATLGYASDVLHYIELLNGKRPV